MQFDGQTVLVTGANRGLGARLVESALKAGAAKVWAGARDPDRIAPEVLAAGRVIPLGLVITDQASVEAAASQASDVDILINNAGVLGYGDPLQGDIELFERDILTNYLGTLRMTRAFVPILERNAPAAIVNVLTIIALAPVSSMAGYCASKAAGHSMTQSLRAELKGRGIAVIGAYPGLIDTEMVAGVEMIKAPADEVAAKIIDGVQAGETILWPDPMSTGAGAAYLENPVALEEMLAGPSH